MALGTASKTKDSIKPVERVHSVKPRIASLAAMTFSLGFTIAAASQQPAPRLPGDLRVNINTQQTADPVSKYIFGSFIEHIGNTIYRSMWAELLDDRKFYFPISSKDPQAPARPQNNPGRTQLRTWRPVGPDEVVVMDKERQFVGEQSPRIALDTSAVHGIRQSGLSLVSGKQYTGRIYLRGTPGAKVTVSLIWGAGSSDKQTLSFAALTNEYKKFPISFTSKASTSEIGRAHV